MRKASFVVLGLSSLLSACAYSDSRPMSYSPDVKGGNGQRVFIWHSKYSAGIASNGGVCAQGALTAEAKSSQTTASMSTAIIDALTKVPSSTPPGDLAKFGQSVNTNVMLTNATNGQTSFANLAFFYICQIALNNSNNAKLSGDQIVEMWKAANDQVSKLSSDAKEVQKLLATPVEGQNTQLNVKTTNPISAAANPSPGSIGSVNP